MESAQVWFVTGSSSGFGRELVEYALSKGDKVIATLRKPEALSDLQAQYSPDRLLVLKLDVTKRDEITNAFVRAKEVFGRVDVVFNNAGYGVLAEVEGTSDKDARDMFEVNFWGAANVSREAITFFRDINDPAGGKLLNVSSLNGIAGQPILGYYAATKFALEGLTETLALELDPEWMIKVTLLELGYFDTLCLNNAVTSEQHPAYQKPTLPTSVTRGLFKPGLKFPGDARKAMAKVYELAHSQDTPLRIALGKDVIATQRSKLVTLAEGLDKYESWSEDLLRDE